MIRLDPSQEKIYALLGGLVPGGRTIWEPRSGSCGRLTERFPNSYSRPFSAGPALPGARQAGPGGEGVPPQCAEIDPDSIDPLFELLKLCAASRDDSRTVAQGSTSEILERDPDNSRALPRAGAVLPASRDERPKPTRSSRRSGEQQPQRVRGHSAADPGLRGPQEIRRRHSTCINGMLKGRPEQPGSASPQGLQPLRAQEARAKPCPSSEQVTPESRFYQDAVVHIAFILQEQGKTDEAVAAAARPPLEKNPENAGAQATTSASIYEEAGRLGGGRATTCKQALEKDPGQRQLPSSAWVSCYDKQKNKEASIEAMRRVIALDPQQRQRAQLPRLHLRRPRPEPG
ncbi:MAG: hypothetical protein MZV70_51655 [Desulfobacterales bacterium]|nr:hypothetical protein [Desulfobacterales bacterium]